MAQESGVMKILLVGLIVVALALAFFPGGLTKLATSDERTITVSGDAEKKVAPDQAKVYLRIYTIDEDAKTSQSDNQDISDEVINALKNAGVKDADIETSSYVLQQKYEYNPENGRSTLVGYETIHVLQVTTENVAGVGALVDTAVGAGANGVDSVSFELRKETEDAVRKELLSGASAQAESKAKSIAEALGVRISGVRAVSESSFIVTPYIYRADAAKEGTQILPRSVGVTAHVSVAYNIR